MRSGAAPSFWTDAYYMKGEKFIWCQTYKTFFLRHWRHVRVSWSVCLSQVLKGRVMLGIEDRVQCYKTFYGRNLQML